MLAENFDPNFSLKHMLKDVRLALGLADDKKIPMPLSDVIEGVFAQGIEKQWGDLDFSVVSRNYDEFLPPKPPVPADQPEPVAVAVAADAPSTTPATDESPVSRPAAVDALPTPPIDLAPVAGTGPNAQKKNTLRILRDFFKPA